MKQLLVMIGLLAFSPTVLAHHSRAEFTDETIRLEGTLTKVVWQNPHIALFLDVATEAGETETWRIEGWMSPSGLEQSGVTQDLFETGEKLVALGRVSKFRNSVLGTNVLFPNGIEALIAPGATSQWGQAVVGGESPPERRLADAATDNLGLFRAWFPAGNPMMQMQRFIFTEAAIAARAQWNPVDNPIVHCEPAGLPNPLFHPQPILFEEDGNDIRLHHAYLDVRRTVHMDASSDGMNQPASPLGFSAGRWEDEHTLSVTTSRIDYPYFDIRGTAQGNEIKIFERYSLSDDQARLTLSLRIEDPVALTQPATAQWEYVALDEPFSVYECNAF